MYILPWSSEYYDLLMHIMCHFMQNSKPYACKESIKFINNMLNTSGPRKEPFDTPGRVMLYKKN